MPIPSNVFNDAVRGFWNQRIAQRQAQELLGKIDQGNRRDVTGGKQMDGFALAITNLLIDAGISQDSIHIKKSLTVLPGFFRPTQTYDFLVLLHLALSPQNRILGLYKPSPPARTNGKLRVS